MPRDRSPHSDWARTTRGSPPSTLGRIAGTSTAQPRASGSPSWRRRTRSGAFEPRPPATCSAAIARSRMPPCPSTSRSESVRWRKTRVPVRWVYESKRAVPFLRTCDSAASRADSGASPDRRWPAGRPAATRNRSPPDGHARARAHDHDRAEHVERVQDVVRGEDAGGERRDDEPERAGRPEQTLRRRRPAGRRVRGHHRVERRVEEREAGRLDEDERDGQPRIGDERVQRCR